MIDRSPSQCILRNWMIAVSVCCFVPQLGAAFADTAFSLAPATQADEHGTEQPGEQRNAGGLFPELFVGDKIYSQEKGEWYLILTPSFAKGSHEKEFELEAELIYGLTDELQLSIEAPYIVLNPDVGHQHQGLGDISLAVDYDFIQNSRMALGVKGQVSIPTGDEDRDLGAGQFLYSPEILSAFRFGEAELYATVGGVFGDDHPDLFTYSVAGAYPWERFIGVLELTGAHGRDSDVVYITPGAYWNASEKIQLGLGVPIGLTEDSDDYQIVGKISFEF